MKKFNTQEIRAGAEALEKAMNEIATTKPQCDCPFGELINDFNESEIDAIIKYQARVCTMVSANHPGGDIRGNHYFFMLVKHRFDLRRQSVLNDEILEEK